MSETAPSAPAGPARDEAPRMFDRIAPSYDVLNRTLSLRRDVAWRRALRKHLPAGEKLEVLDLATGTADVLLELAPTGRIGRGVGMDLSGEMLAIGRTKISAQGLSELLVLQDGDAVAIPAEDASFDAVTIAFGIRNLVDTVQGLREMRRVLRPGGRALVLECSLPPNALMRAGYLLYFRHILPFIGGIVSGDRTAYRYLNETVETFPCGEAFLALMREAGFANVKADPQTFGVATIYVGDRPE